MHSPEAGSSSHVPESHSLKHSDEAGVEGVLEAGLQGQGVGGRAAEGRVVKMDAGVKGKVLGEGRGGEGRGGEGARGGEEGVALPQHPLIFDDTFPSRRELLFEGKDCKVSLLRRCLPSPPSHVPWLLPWSGQSVCPAEMTLLGRVSATSKTI